MKPGLQLEPLKLRLVLMVVKSRIIRVLDVVVVELHL